jgi:antitoxin component YwqK of YwqJK toxin-antitoxin module
MNVLEEHSVIKIDWYSSEFNIQGPAILYVRNGKLHREDGPAVEYENGDKYWYIDGELHREDGPAVINANGSLYWFSHDKLHREDGPAVESGIIKKWYKNGILYKISAIGIY